MGKAFMLYYLSLFFICIQIAFAACPGTPEASARQVAALKLDLIPLRQRCEGTFFGDYDAQSTCTVYWEKMEELNLALENRLCWYHERYTSIRDRSSSYRLHEIMEQLNVTKELLTIVYDDERSEEEILKAKIASIGDNLIAMSTRMLSLALDDSSFTSEQELDDTTAAVESATSDDVQTLVQGVEDAFAVAVDDLLNKLSETLGEGETLVGALKEVLDALQDQLVLTEQDIRALIRHTDFAKNLRTEFYLASCTASWAAINPFMKQKTDIEELVTYVQNLKTQVENAGYSIANAYTTNMNYANYYSNRGDRSFKYVAAAYQAFGAAQTASACA